MKKILLVAAAAAGLATLAPAFAAEGNGTITISGKVTATTCTIANNGNVTVTLPDVSTSSLATAASTSGRQAFAINLSGCSGTTVAKAYFEPGANIDPTTGNLRIATGVGKATNVQVQLYNADLSPINLFSNNAKTTTLTSASGPVNFYAGYYATGQATAGDVNTSVIYTMQYN